MVMTEKEFVKITQSKQLPNSTTTAIGTGDNIVDKDYLDKVMAKSNINYNYGWICPRCGKVLAPDVKECTCKPEPKSNTKTYIDDKDSFLTIQPEGHCRIVSPEYRHCENKDNPTYEKCRFCSQWVICKTEPKSNINDSFYQAYKNGFCQSISKLSSCPQYPNYDRCHNCPNWIEIIPL